MYFTYEDTTVDDNIPHDTTLSNNHETLTEDNDDDDDGKYSYNNHDYQYFLCFQRFKYSIEKVYLCKQQKFKFRPRLIVSQTI